MDSPIRQQQSLAPTQPSTSQFPIDTDIFDEKATDYPTTDSKLQQSSTLPDPSNPHVIASSTRKSNVSVPVTPSPFLRQAPFSISHSRVSSHQSSYTRPRGLRISNLVRPWIPLIMYAITSLAFVVAIALYRDEVFARLDELSLWLRDDEQYGHAILFALIFLTTIPPIPLYSTLIVLSGYTFGPWTGAIISYFAALSGALLVFIVSRSLLRDSISRWLNSCGTIKRVVRAIEKRPKLLFLIRLAPYPYNVMNCLLAASPTLTLHTYTVCTALSLFKVIIHTSLGASIHSFKEYHGADPKQTSDDNSADVVAQAWTIVGILLCVLILVYLSIVARRAVDDELDDGPISHDNEETMAFLSPSSSDLEGAHGQPMTESPFRGQHMMPYRSSLSAEPETNGQWP